MLVSSSPASSRRLLKACIGQSDMPVSVARRLLPANTIIGVSCNNLLEIEKAIQDGADYVGIGAVWSTTTKDLVKPIIGGPSELSLMCKGAEHL